VILRKGYGLDGRIRVIDFRTSISSTEIVGVSFNDIVSSSARSFRVDRFGKNDLKTITLNANLFDFEWCFTSPIEPLDGKGFFSADGPLSVGGKSTRDELPFGSKLHIHDSCRETLAKWVTGTLPNPIDFFGLGSQDETH